MPPDSGVSAPGRLGGAGGSGSAAAGAWASFVTGKIEWVVSIIRDKAISRISTAVHFAIFALIALTIGAMLVVVFTIGLLRVFDDEVFHRDVWASYFVIAGIFAVLGMLCVWLRHPRS
ncbi:MAG: hypothetical protein ACRD0Z_07120 [Acidimicrobiales bacterium]